MCMSGSCMQEDIGLLFCSYRLVSASMEIRDCQCTWRPCATPSFSAATGGNHPPSVVQGLLAALLENLYGWPSASSNDWSPRAS